MRTELLVLALLPACQPALPLEPAGERTDAPAIAATSPAPTDPITAPTPAPAPAPVEPALSGPLRLELTRSLGAEGRQIAFIDDTRWLSSAGYRVTAWEGHVPKATLTIDAYHHLAISDDLTRAFADHAVLDLATSQVSPISPSPAVLGEHPGLELERLRISPDGALALLEPGWRPPRGIPRTGPDGERTYRHVYRNTRPEQAKSLYLLDPTTGATLLKIAAADGHHAWVAFSPRFVALGGAPSANEVALLARPALTTVRTVAMTDFVNQVRISPDESLLLAADDRGAVTLWDMSSGTVRSSWAAHPEPTGAVVFHPRAPLLVTTGNDHTIKLWRISGEPTLLATLPIAGRPLAAAFDRGGTKLHVGLDRHEHVAESIAVVALVPGS